MSWICYSQGISCWCPSPMESIKTGAMSIYDAAKDGILKITEAVEATKNYVSDKVGQVSEGLKGLGRQYVENIQELMSIASHLYEQFLEPAIHKIMEWLQYMVEVILEKLAYLLKAVGDAVFNSSVWIYKKIFSIALGREDFGDLMKDLFIEIVKLIDPNVRELTEDFGEQIKEIEPYGTIFTLLEGFQTVIDFLTNIINPEKLLQNLVDTYIRPWVVDYFKDLLPLEKIPIPEIEDLILNLACDNVFNVGQLFGHPTAGLEASMERIVQFMIKRAMEGAVSISEGPESDVPGWAWDIVITFLTLEGIVIGVISFGGGESAVPPKFSQVGTAIDVIGLALGILNLLSIAGNYVNADFLGDDVKEVLNSMRRGKDFALSTSTGTVLTIAGLLIQLLGGSAAWPEYIVPALALYVNLLGFVAAIGSGGIKSDPLFVALIELYEEINAEEEPDIVGGAKENLFAGNEKALALYADYKNPTQVTANPVILVDTPWYGPDFIGLCFVDRDYGRARAPDFIDEEGNIKNFWISANVRNTSLVSARIHINFFYSIDNGPLQHLYDATRNKDNGDELNPKEVRDYFFQNWQFLRSGIADVCRGRYKIVATVSVDGDYDQEKSLLQTAVQIRIAPHFKLDPISIRSNTPIRKKERNGQETPLIQEGDLITLSTKITNTGGKFTSNKKVAVRWYIDTEEGKQKVIAKQYYGTADGSGLGYGDEIPVSLDLETTNLGLSSMGLSSMSRLFKAAILKSDFSDCIAEDMPLFTDKQEVAQVIEFDTRAPNIQIKRLDISNSAPVEGDIIICGCLLRNPGKVPVSTYNNITMNELAEDRRTVLRQHRPITEFLDPNFLTLPFDGGNSNDGLACKFLSFDFVPMSDMWIDSIKIRPKPGTSEQVKCSKIRILYLGWPVISTDPNWDSNTGIHYLNHPVLLEEEKEYHFEIEVSSGTPMVGERDFNLANRVVIKNAVMTRDDNSFDYKHPKIKLLLLKTLPPEGEAKLEMAWDTATRNETKFLQWNFSSAAQNLEVNEIIPIDVREPKIKGFKLTCDDPAKMMGRVRSTEYLIKAIWENQDPSIAIQKISVMASATAPKGVEKQVKLYLKPDPSAAPIVAQGVPIDLGTSNSREFLVGIAVSKSVPVGTLSTFSVKAVATVEAIRNNRSLKQTLEMVLNLQFHVSSDYTEIFDLSCYETRREVQRQTQTKYPVMLYNRAGEDLTINISSKGQSQNESKNWEYYFIRNKGKKISVELGATPEDLEFCVESELPNEIMNTIIANYSWDPFLEQHPDFSVDKSIDILTIFEEEPFPIGLNFRSSRSAADPGVPFTLTALFTVLLTAEQPSYSVSLDVEGEVDLISQPARSVQLARGESQTITWDVRLRDDATVGAKVPIKLIVRTGERSTSSVLNIAVTSLRKEYDFSVKTDWRVLSIIQGRQGTIVVSVENIGRRTDTIKLVATQMLPVGWYARPSIRHVSVKPDQTQSTTFSVAVPKSATIGESGKVVITASSKNNPALTQVRQVIVKAAAPGAKWSVELTPNKLKKSIGTKGASTFAMTVNNNGNRPLGEVNLTVKHKYNPIQFSTSITPEMLNLRHPGATGKASVVIEPKLTGPGTYKFELIARWQEKIAYAEDRKTVQLDYSAGSFVTSKYGIMMIGTAAALITTLLLLYYFVF